MIYKTFQQLTNDRVIPASFRFDKEDIELIKSRSWIITTSGYPSGRPHLNNVYLLHLMLMKPPEGYEVDHIDGDRANCKRSNLRITSHQTNAFARKMPTGASGVRGVRLRKNNKFEVKIVFKGKHIHLGTFLTLEAARNAYLKAALQYFGEIPRM